VPETRMERDTMGEMPVPIDALYGAETARAVQNFPISGMRLQRPFIRALGLVKACAAAVNGAHGWVEPAKAAAIERAALEAAEGRYDDQFVVDVFQTGSGTSTNMNCNEIIGRLTQAHPNDEVNRSQSSNDVFPTAMHIAAAETVHSRLFPAINELEGELCRKARAFHDVVKIGRTHLQDAVPMRLGQEFGAYAYQMRCARARIQTTLAGILELPLGGTAVGTGLNAPQSFAGETIAMIARLTGLPFVEAANHFEAQASKDALVFLSGALRGYAVALTKIANDVRWLACGPRCGLGELKLPAVQPGSSIMPGKVNPVIAESLLMVCAQVIGYDATIASCAAAGNFELNVMMPVMAFDLLESIGLLSAASENFARRLVAGIEADRERIGHFVERSLAMATALTPEIGYEKAAELVKEAYAKGATVREVTPETLHYLLDARTQAGE
jgi:fumarate hydratase, class II